MSKLPAAPRPGELGAALEDLAEVLSQLPAAAMLIGGLAVIARGFPRTTRDIDVTVRGGEVDLADLLRAFERGGFEARIADAVAFAGRSQVLLLRHAATQIELDVSLGWLSFELEAIAAAEPLTIGGVRLPVARAEDLVVYKAVAWRPQDQQDIERLLGLHGGDIDLARVRCIVRQLAEALDDPDRLRELDRIIERAAE